MAIQHAYSKIHGLIFLVVYGALTVQRRGRGNGVGVIPGGGAGMGRIDCEFDIIAMFFGVRGLLKP